MSGVVTVTVQRLWHLAVSSLHNQRTKNALRREMAELGPDEENRVLRDCGLSRSEFATLLQNSLATEDLLSPAMNSIGLDPVAWRERYPAWGREMARVCMACDFRRRCHGDMVGGRVDAFREYCPNSADLAEMARTGRKSDTGIVPRWM